MQTEGVTKNSVELDASAKDRGFSVAKITLSYIPFVGPALAELVSVTIPNQRMDRFAEFMRQLNERVDEIEMVLKNEGKEYPERIALIETGAEQSTRARSNERIKRIASIVIRGINNTEQEALELHRLLRILPQIDDQELLLLYYFAGDGQKKREISTALNLPEELRHGSDRELFKKHQLFVLGIEHLSALGLLNTDVPDVEISFPRSRMLDGSAVAPKVQKSKKDKADAYQALRNFRITSLGHLMVEALSLD